MSKSTIPAMIGVGVGALLAPKFIQKFLSPKKMEARWITPYKAPSPRPKPIAKSMWSMSPFYVWIAASILLVPFAILYFYPQVQALFISDPGSIFFRSNGQYLMMITWLLTGTLFFLLIAIIAMRPFPKIMNRYYAGRTEDNLIMAKKLKRQTDFAARNKQLEKIASEYDFARMNSDDIKRFIKVDIILLLITLPFYALGFYSYTRINSEEIAIAPVWSYSEQVRTWNDLSSVEIYLEDGEHITPHFDLNFQDGEITNIWNFSIPQQPTEDLLAVRDLAEAKGIPVNIDFVYQSLSSLRESGRIQIKEVMNVKTGIDDYIEEGSALYELIHGNTK